MSNILQVACTPAVFSGCPADGDDDDDDGIDDDDDDDDDNIDDDDDVDDDLMHRSREKKACLE